MVFASSESWSRREHGEDKIDAAETATERALVVMVSEQTCDYHTIQLFSLDLSPETCILQGGYLLSWIFLVLSHLPSTADNTTASRQETSKTEN